MGGDVQTTVHNIYAMPHRPVQPYLVLNMEAELTVEWDRSEMMALVARRHPARALRQIGIS